MGLFESIATRHGRKKGELQRLLHMASGQSLWTGEVLINKARGYAEADWYAGRYITANTHWDERVRHSDRYTKAFILAYTNSKVVTSNNIPEVKDASQEMDVRYGEERN